MFFVLEIISYLLLIPIMIANGAILAPFIMFIPFLFMRIIGPPITETDKKIDKISKESINHLEEFSYFMERHQHQMKINEYERAIDRFSIDPDFRVKKSLTKKAIKSKVRLRNMNKEKAKKMIFDKNDIFYAGYSDAFVNSDQREMFTGDDKDNYIEGYDAGLIMREDF